MFTLGIIEENVENPNILSSLQPYFFHQRLEEVPEDALPLWHTNEYHVPDDEMVELLPLLEAQVKPSWYIHAFNETKLIVILQGKSFYISLHKDTTWDEMIAYGLSVDVEKRYLETIPLHV